MRDDDESKLDQETIPAPEPSSPLPHSAFALAPCDVALEFRSETALFFPTPRSVASRSFTTTQRSLPPTSAHPLFIGPAAAQMKSVILLSRT